MGRTPKSTTTLQDDTPFAFAARSLAQLRRTARRSKEAIRSVPEAVRRVMRLSHDDTGVQTAAKPGQPNEGKGLAAAHSSRLPCTPTSGSTEEAGAQASECSDGAQEIKERMRWMALKAMSTEMSMERTSASQAKGMYSEENMRRRLELMDNPDILELLERLWVSANTDDSDAIIDHSEYVVMHRKSTHCPPCTSHLPYLDCMSTSMCAARVTNIPPVRVTTGACNRRCVCHSPPRPRPHDATIHRITPGRGGLENRL